MGVELVGIEFFGYLISNMNSIIVKIDSISELKENMEDTVNIHLIRLDKVLKERIMNGEYFRDTTKYYLQLWDKDFGSVIESPFYKGLKP